MGQGLIVKILEEAKKPLTSKQIAERVKGKITPASVNSNLRALRKGGQVKFEYKEIDYVPKTFRIKAYVYWVGRRR